MRICLGPKGWAISLFFAIFCCAPPLVLASSPECLISFDAAQMDVCEDRVVVVNEALEPLADPRAFADSPIRVVKFDGPLGRAQSSALQALGAEILGYVPFYGYKVRMAPALDAQARQVPGVIWAGPYLPAWKVDVNVANELSDENILRQTDQVDSLWISLHSGVSGDQARGRMESIAGVDFRFDGTVGDHPFVVLGFDRARLSDIVGQLAMNDEVDSVNFHWPDELLNSQGPWLHQSGQSSPEHLPIFEQGIFGCGQITAALDSGLHTAHCSFNDPDFGPPVFDICGNGANCPPITPDFDHRKVGAHYQWSDGSTQPGDRHGHGTFVSGNMVGNNLAGAVDCQDYTTPGGVTNLDGMAPGAKMIIQEMGPSLSYLSLGGTLYHAATVAHGNGAHIHNNSWGSSCRNQVGQCIAGCQVEYRAHSRGADAAAWENPELLIFVAAGNSGGGNGGPGCGPGADVGAAGNAKNILSIGANQRGTSGNNMASFSSRGPASDRRTKPDIVAQGQSLQSSSVSACGTTGNNGTSFASPTAAGLGALVREYLQRGFYPLGIEEPASAIPNPSAALIKAIMINGSVEIDGTGTSGDYPDQNQGWGRILLDNALYFDGDDRRLWLHDGTGGLEAGDVDTHQVVAEAGEPLAITLVWNDFPAEINADPHIVNLLRLEVEAPGGEVWTQKLPAGGGLANANPYQDTTTADYDDRNNVHQIVFETPATGAYTVRVHAIQVAMGDAQPYALAITGDLSDSGVDPVSAEVCTADGSTSFTLSLSPQFEGTTDLSATGEPAGTSGDFAPNPVIFPDDESVYTLSDLANASGGQYALEFIATDSVDPDITITVGADLTLYESVTGQIPLLMPADAATDVALQPAFTWDGADAAEYQIQVASDPGFATIVIDETIADTGFVPAVELATGTIYYWRVRGLNACGEGDWSDEFSFTTRLEPVAAVNPESFDLEVPQNGTGSDTLSITNAGTGNLVWSLATDEDACTEEPVDVPWLSASPDAGSTSAGQTDEVTVMVDAAGLAPGPYAGHLCLATNAEGQEVISIAVALTVTEGAPGELEVDPLSLDFGPVGMGGDALLAVTVSNVAAEGALDLELAQIAVIAGAPEFEIADSDCDTALPAQESCTVQVRFAPSSQVPYVGIVRIVATGQPTVNVELSGSGTDALPVIFEDRFEQ